MNEGNQTEASEASNDFEVSATATQESPQVASAATPAGEVDSKAPKAKAKRARKPKADEESGEAEQPTFQPVVDHSLPREHVLDIQSAQNAHAARVQLENLARQYPAVRDLLAERDGLVEQLRKITEG